jgi:hypothetical protein
VVTSPARDLELADVGFLQRLVALLRVEPDEQRVLPDADEQVAVQQEADATEHPLLLDVLAPGQQVADALGKRFAEGHRSLHRGWFSGQPGGHAPSILSGCRRRAANRG